MAGCCKGNIYIPTAFEECNTIEMQIAWLGKKYAELEERVAALEGENAPADDSE